MNRICIAWIIVVFFWTIQNTEAQEVSSANNGQTNPRESEHGFWPSIRLTADVEFWFDIARRESLLFLSDWSLEHRCGRYWVDRFSRLIAPNDRPVGYWGIDHSSRIPAGGNRPIR